MAKPDWAARAAAWTALGSPLWPWERRRSRRALSAVLPDAWPWERRRRQGLTAVLPDAWPWERRRPQGLTAVLPDAGPWKRQGPRGLRIMSTVRPWERPRRRVGGLLSSGLPWERRTAPRQFAMLVPPRVPWSRQNRGVTLLLRNQRRQPPAEAWKLLVAAAVGGALVYFLDPTMGNRRRKMAAQRTGKLARRSLRGLAKTGRRLGSAVSGKRQALLHSRDAHDPLDDATLAHKVESILFRDPHVPKGRININAEHGVVVLRGEVEQPADVRDIERRVREVDGVHGVRSMLHLANGRA
jgi:hypothetical protein